MNQIPTSYPKEKVKILLLENISEKAIQLFSDYGYTQIKKISSALSEDALIEEIKNVHILGIRSKTNVTARVFEYTQKLKAIGCFCIGTNQVDLKFATQKGIAVFNAPYSNTRSVAELVIGSAIFLIRKITEKNKKAHEGKWFKEVKDSYELRGKTLGIIGYGNIGTQVSILAEAMGMKVIYYDVQKKLSIGNAISMISMTEVFKNADIITLHVPETKSTQNLINKEALSLFKKGSILINYARGNVVDLDDLQSFLISNHIGGAAIDVFPFEPEKNGDSFTCPLQNLPNVILTPHIGGSTEEAQTNIGEDVSQRLIEYLEKGTSIGSHSIPELSLPAVENTHRILHIHKNIPGVLSEINKCLSNDNINIVGQYLKTNEDIGYVVLDVNKKFNKISYEAINKINGTIKTRILF